MLNNDFQVLANKYKRYKQQQKKRRLLKLLLFILLATLAYFLFTSMFKDKRHMTPVENNQSDTNLTQAQTNKEVSDINHSETNASNIEINQHGLQVTTEESSLEQLTKNQEKYKNYSSTIALANYHFSKKEYKEAIKWAIAASKKNQSKVRPWIIYAKSKLADGKVDIAKKALSLYLKKHKSQEAQDLLDKLKAI